MIRQSLEGLTLNSYAGTNSELIVPSKVLTSYAKEEETVDISYSNFMITTEMNKAYVDNIYVGGRYPVEMQVDSYNYNAYMNVVSWCNIRNGVKLTLQYADGLSSTYAPEP